ncbi:MAG TPA: SURF1 family protein [Euzebyales bacterium]|nr:SURF1 family protein [Euzebyales bacterium]
MYRFLLRPRWIAGHLLVIVTVVAFVNLGLWQLRRLDERQSYNARVTERLAADPQPLDAALAGVGGATDDLEFRRVTVAGTFAGAQVLTAPRNYAGRPGQQVLSVLERADGPAVLVDRGWMPFDRGAQQPPAAPDGRVEVHGVLRLRESGDVGAADQVAQIVPAQIAERLGRRLAPFYVQLQGQQPPPAAGSPTPTPLPELTEGNHRSYAVQWFSFALIALVGYPILVWRTARQDDDPTGATGWDVPVAPTSRDEVAPQVHSDAARGRGHDLG